MMIELWKREGIKQGIEQGIEEKCFDVVYNMLKEKFDFKTISKITGLSLNKIKNISKNLGY